MYQKMLAQKQAAAAAAAGGSSSSSDAPPAVAKGPSPPVLSVRSVTPPEAPVVVLFGSTNYAEMGKKPGAEAMQAINLRGPHRLLAGFGGARIVSIATGCTSAHVIAIGAGGEAFAWGRNDNGQLGLGDASAAPRLAPERVALLKGTPISPISRAATGKAHTVFLSTEGELLACGACKQGAVGNGVKKAEQTPTPTPLVLPSGVRFVHVASGQNFNLAIDAEGDVWSWGWSEFGVLGHGTDGEWNTKEGSVKLSYSAETVPKRISALAGLGCVDVACGQHHCAAIDREGVVYTWGNGGYGRLGHKDQQDQWTPKSLRDSCVRAREVSCGSAHTAAIGWTKLANGDVCWAAKPSLFMWGRVKGASQNAWMYPTPEEDMRGWSMKHMSCGASHNVAAADASVIAWGSACLSGELGFGSEGKKSSARPDKVLALEGGAVAQITCGLANSILLVERSAAVDKLPEWDPSLAGPPPAAVDRSSAANSEGAAASAAGASKAGASKAKGKAAAKGKRAVADEPKDDEDEDDPDEEYKPEPTAAKKKSKK